jgi:hypothetical protein
MKIRIFIGIVVVGVALYGANVLRNQAPFSGTVEIAAHTKGRDPRPCPPVCTDNQQARMQRTWYGWDGKLVRKSVF